MRIFLILIILTIFTGCRPVSQDVQEAYLVMHRFAAKEKQENQLEVFGVGAAMFDKIKSLKLTLISHKEMDIEEARKLYIESSQAFLQMINDTPSLRPYLQHYPFTIKDIQLGIGFWEGNDRQKYYEPPSVAYVFYVNDVIYYETYDSASQNFFESDYSESYADALRKMREKDSKCFEQVTEMFAAKSVHLD